METFFNYLKLDLSRKALDKLISSKVSRKENYEILKAYIETAIEKKKIINIEDLMENILFKRCYYLLPLIEITKEKIKNSRINNIYNKYFSIKTYENLTGETLPYKINTILFLKHIFSHEDEIENVLWNEENRRNIINLFENNKGLARAIFFSYEKDDYVTEYSIKNISKIDMSYPLFQFLEKLVKQELSFPSDANEIIKLCKIIKEEAPENNFNILAFLLFEVTKENQLELKSHIWNEVLKNGNCNEIIEEFLRYRLVYQYVIDTDGFYVITEKGFQEYEMDIIARLDKETLKKIGNESMEQLIERFETENMYSGDVSASQENIVNTIDTIIKQKSLKEGINAIPMKEKINKIITKI